MPDQPCPCKPPKKIPREQRVYFYKCPLCGDGGAHVIPSSVLKRLKTSENAAPEEFQFNGTTAWSTPHASIAGGCHPDQVKGFNEALKRRGVTGAHFNERGERIESSRKGRKEANELFNMHDKDGMWSD